MKVISRDTRENSHIVCVQFDPQELSELGITMFNYHGGASKDEEIIQAIKNAFKMHRIASSMAMHNYQPAKIVRDAVEKLSTWMTAAENVVAAGLVSERSDK